MFWLSLEDLTRMHQQFFYAVLMTLIANITFNTTTVILWYDFNVTQ